MSTTESIRTLLASFKVNVIRSNALLIDALAGNDRITGGSAAQTIYGGSGDDNLQGVGGDDILWGDGSSTDDTFVAGHDTFVFEKVLADNGVDIIMDFGIAGHKTAGVLQAGNYVADTLDLSRIQFTGVTNASDDENTDGCGDDEIHITAANVNDYVSVKNGDLYIDTDGLGEGQAVVWAHLNGVAGGDLLNLKLDDFQGQIEAQAQSSFGFALDFVLGQAGSVRFSEIFDGNLTRTPDRQGLLLDGKLISESELLALDNTVGVILHGTEETSNQALADATWSANGQQGLGTIDVSTWTYESMTLNMYKFYINKDWNADNLIDYQDVLAHKVDYPDDVTWADGILDSAQGSVGPNIVIAYFDASAYASGDNVQVVGSYQGSVGTQSMVAI